MSERRPLNIDAAQWPIVARADAWFGGEIECQASDEQTLRVRQHGDGRRIVYGWQCAGGGGQYAGTRNPRGGFLVDAQAGRPDDDGTIHAIRRVGGILANNDLAAECIADLPAEAL